MFGHQNDQDNNQTNNHNQVNDITRPVVGAPMVGVSSNSDDNSISADDITNDNNKASNHDNQKDDNKHSQDSDLLSLDDNNLLDIKRQALTQLTPLLSHIDQTAEEKFRTLMMMIQASDNQLLIRDAYQTAQQISDEKVKAQALLDIINEINYFTHHDNAA